MRLTLSADEGCLEYVVLPIYGGTDIRGAAELLVLRVAGLQFGIALISTLISPRHPAVLRGEWVHQAVEAAVQLCRTGSDAARYDAVVVLSRLAQVEVCAEKAARVCCLADEKHLPVQ